jgi:hypothetical protein
MKITLELNTEQYISLMSLTSPIKGDTGKYLSKPITSKTAPIMEEINKQLLNQYNKHIEEINKEIEENETANT